MDKLDRSEFRQVVKNTPLVSIDLIVRNEKGEVLLGLRKNEPAKNTWFVPGASIRKDNSIERAFPSITKDELGVGVDLSNAHFVQVAEHFYKENFYSDPDFGTHYVVFAYELHLSLDTSQLPDDQHSAYKYMSEEDILSDKNVHRYTQEYFQQTKRS